MQCINLCDIPHLTSLSPNNLLRYLYRKTAGGGVIVMPDLLDDSFEDSHSWLRCEMKWNRHDMEQTCLVARQLYQSMKKLALMRKILTETTPENLTQDASAAALLRLWEIFAKPLAKEESSAYQEAQTRLPQGQYAYGVIMTHSWLYRLLELDAPDIVLRWATLRCALALMIHWDTATVTDVCQEEVI